MRLPRCRHSWRLDIAKAVEMQRRLAVEVRSEPLRESPRLVAGLDCAFSPDGRWCVAAAVAWDLQSRRAVEEQVARMPVRFPYVPGLLSFREAPALLTVLRLLRLVPDVLMCDGHGLAHPRRFGLACHVGLLTGVPTVGCAKSRLVGPDVEPGWQRGAAGEVLMDGQVLGLVLRTRDGVKPVHVSVGHRITLEEARELVLACTEGKRLPEPTRLADRRVSRERLTGRCG